MEHPRHTSAGESNRASFRIHTLGLFRASFQGVNSTFRSRKAQALFAYLVLARNMIESRERLAGLLWSDNSEEAARTSLRQEIAGIRKATGHLPSPVFDCDRSNVWLQTGNVTADVLILLDDLEQERLPPVMVAQRRLFEDFLVNLRDLDPSFDTWLSVQREYLHDRALKLLQDQMRSETDPVGLEERATAIHNLDPTHEEACRNLMSCRARRGDTASALRVYNELWEVLGTDYDMEPSAQTQALVAQIKSADPAISSGAVSPVPARAGRTDTGDNAALRNQTALILVHPFVNEVPDQDHTRRINGFRHDLIAALTRFRDWSVREYSAIDDGAPVGGHKVYDLIATATAEDDRLHIAVLLRRKADGHYMWSENATVEIGRWQAAKLLIIQHLAAALDVQISAERLNTTAAIADPDLDIFDRWLRGNELLSHWRPAAEDRAEQIFRSIIRDAHDFAPAYAGLAQILNSRHLIFPGIMRDRGREQEALRLAGAATKLAPMDCRTRLTLAWSYLMNEKFEQAIHCYELALKMNDNDPWTLISCAEGLAHCGEKVLANEIAARALRVGYGAEPIHWAYHACIRFLNGNNEGAVEAADLADGATFYTFGLKAAAKAELGQRDAAREEARIFVQRVGENWHGALPPSPESVLEWFCQCLPIRFAADRERLRCAILDAGLLDQNISFHRQPRMV